MAHYFPCSPASQLQRQINGGDSSRRRRRRGRRALVPCDGDLDRQEVEEGGGSRHRA